MKFILIFALFLTATISVPVHSSEPHYPSFSAYNILLEQGSDYTVELNQHKRIVVKSKRFVDNTIEEVAYTIWCESKGETAKGKLLVADSIRNRVAESRFPNDYSSVIHAPRQYACWGRSGVERIHGDEWFNGLTGDRVQYIKMAVKHMHDITPPTSKSVLFYHTTAIVPYWASNFNLIGQYGVHKFYERKVGGV